VPPARAGWWWIAQSGAAAVPSPPTVPPGGLMVGAGPGGATAIAALRFELDPDQGSPVVTLAVAPNGDVNGAGAALAACPAASMWASAYAGAWESKPASTCGRAVRGVRSADGLTWTFGLASVVVDNVIDVVLEPQEGTNFNLVFAPPTTATLKTSPKPVAAVSVDPAIEPNTALPADTAGATILSDSTGAPLAGSEFTPANDELTLAAPAAGGTTSPALTTATGSRRITRGSALAILLLLDVGIAAYVLNQVTTPALRALGPLAGTARRATKPVAPEVGGLGRFARPRSGPPPRL
jgi:hypothetical protein